MPGTAGKNQNSGRLKNFFFGKKETLTQSLFDGMVKAVFSGIIVAIASLYVLESVERSIERSKKQEALRQFQNSAISESLEAIGEAYSSLDCTRNIHLTHTSACRTEIDSFIGLLKIKEDFLLSVIPEKNFRSIEHLISTAREMKRIQKDKLSDDQIEELSRLFSKGFRNLMSQVSANFQ